jgi:glycine cleavage system regulatory protein
MCRLGGQFAGILRVEVPEARADALGRALLDLEKNGLRATVHVEDGALPAVAGSTVTFELVGQDHPGILRQVSTVLAAHGVNVEELASECVSAPMGGGNLFQARATVRVPPSVNMTTLRTDLEKIAADVMVDLKLG